MIIAMSVRSVDCAGSRTVRPPIGSPPISVWDTSTAYVPSLRNDKLPHSLRTPIYGEADDVRSNGGRLFNISEAGTPTDVVHAPCCLIVMTMGMLTEVLVRSQSFARE